jgi:hypothetical protein
MYVNQSEYYNFNKPTIECDNWAMAIFALGTYTNLNYPICVVPRGGGRQVWEAKTLMR